MKEIINKQVSEVLQEVLAHKEEYWLDDVYIRWGIINEELVERIYNALTTSDNSDYAKCPKCGDRLQLSCTNAGCDYIEKFEKHFA
jgi:hypothetical protein